MKNVASLDMETSSTKTDKLPHLLNYGYALVIALIATFNMPHRLPIWHISVQRLIAKSVEGSDSAT